MRAALVAVLLQACWSAPPPAAPSAQAPPARGHTMDPADFEAMLERDWTDAIDPVAGVVMIEVGTGDPPHNWCRQRGAHYVKFEALDLKAAMIQGGDLVVACTSLERDVVECHARGQKPHFRFVWREGRFMLIGVARYSGQMPRADAVRYETALRTSQRCAREEEDEP